MQMIELNPEVSISRLGLGTYHLTDRLSEIDAIEALRAAEHAGITLIDTSNNYRSEAVIGLALRDGVLHEADTFIATKAGLAITWPQHQKLRTQGRTADSTPEYLRSSVDGSISVLGVKALDLFQLHDIDETVTPLSIASTMTELVESGKVRQWGVTNYSKEAVDDLLSACDKYDAVRPATAQLPLDLVTGVTDAVQIARDEGMIVLGRSPLGYGLFTDSGIDQARDIIEQADPEKNIKDALLITLDKLDEIRDQAHSVGVAFEELALAWVMSHDRTAVLNSCYLPEYLQRSVRAERWDAPQALFDTANELHENPLYREMGNRLIRVMHSTRPQLNRSAHPPQ